MSKLIGDLGSMGARVYIKNYGGKPHIILKGYAGLRTVLTGTKYGIKNPKVISMGLGKAGATSAAKQGGILTVILLSLYRVADYILTDEATLSQLIGTLATDVVKVGIATAASIGAAIVAGAITTIAVGPIVAVILVGVGVSILLEFTDNKLGITNRVISGLDELSENMKYHIAQKKEGALESAGKVVSHVIEQAVDEAQTIVINWVQHQFKKYLSPSWKIR